MRFSCLRLLLREKSATHDMSRVLVGKGFESWAFMQAPFTTSQDCLIHAVQNWYEEFRDREQD